MDGLGKRLWACPWSLHTPDTHARATGRKADHLPMSPEESGRSISPTSFHHDLPPPYGTVRQSPCMLVQRIANDRSRCVQPRGVEAVALDRHPSPLPVEVAL